MLGPMVRVRFILQETVQLPSRAAGPFCIPAAMNLSSVASHLLQRLMLSVFQIWDISVGV